MDCYFCWSNSHNRIDILAILDLIVKIAVLIQGKSNGKILLPKITESLNSNVTK